MSGAAAFFAQICAEFPTYPVILLRLPRIVTKKTLLNRKIWVPFAAFQRYFAKVSSSGGYQLSLNHRMARRNDRAG